MCGICGFIDVDRRRPPGDLESTVERMAATLAHRGPDDRGAWVDAEAGVALGHRRLAIIDPGPGGRQPMTSSCGRWVIVFNGEIYNYRDIARELGGPDRGAGGRSDTGVMLEAISRWGPTRAIERFNGMFAFALWDRSRRRLLLARDRIGEKPLYYARLGATWIFGSELVALRAHPEFDAEIDREALALFTRLGCVPAPRTIWRGVRKAPPASIVAIDPSRPEPSIEPYWRLEEVVARGASSPLGSAREAVEALETQLRRSLADRLHADVPVGAFLSGGIDSSLIVALAQRVSSTPVRTFTIGFRERAFDEAASAREVAAHLGTDHRELILEPRDALEVIPRLPEIHDEPFADSSQIPASLLSRMTRRHVTVAISGDGGDELFGGYNRYAWADVIWRRVGRLPRSVRRVASRALLAAPASTWDGVVRRAARAVGMRGPRFAGEKVHKLGRAITADGFDSLYRGLISQWEVSPVLGEDGVDDTLVDESSEEGIVPASIERAMLHDALTYLPDDILVKVDRASMAVGLEVRAPLLDPDVIALAWRMPMRMKVRRTTGKWILRELLGRHVPTPLFDRPKTGFVVPLAEWLRGELRDWAESLLDEGRLADEGYLDPRPVRALWEQHLAGRFDWHGRLWVVLMFQAWMERQGRSRTRTRTRTTAGSGPGPGTGTF